MLEPLRNSSVYLTFAGQWNTPGDRYRKRGCFEQRVRVQIAIDEESVFTTNGIPTNIPNVRMSYH